MFSGAAILRLGVGFVGGVLRPAGSPLRRLYQLPFFIALASHHPVAVLQLQYGACWLGEALAAAWICGLLLPGRRLGLVAELVQPAPTSFRKSAAQVRARLF